MQSKNVACVHCGGTGIEPNNGAERVARLEAEEQRLRSRAKDLDLWVSGDGTRIPESGLAALLEKKDRDIGRRWRRDHPEHPVHCKVGSRYFWKLRELAVIAVFGWEA